MEKIKVWTSGITSDPDIYAYLVDFEKISGIQVNVNRPPFGIGVSGSIETVLIQGDGIQWFLEQCPAIRLALPQWVLDRIELQELKTIDEKLNHVLMRLQKITAMTEYARNQSTPFDVLHNECKTLIEEIQTGLIVDRSLINN